MENNKKYIIYFETNNVSVFELKDNNPTLIVQRKIFFNETFVNDEMLNKIRSVLQEFKQTFGFLDNKRVRIFATGIFQELSKEEKSQVVIDAYVHFGVVFNILSLDLESFYKNIGNNNIISGLCKKEFRKVVICGSFQKNMKEIEKLMNSFYEHDIEVLSPWTLNIVPESIGTDFILLEGQELLNERDSWRHKYDHMNKFNKADAIIVCNPEGRIGKGTMFEFGFMVANAKRIIFTNEPEGLTIHFPYEIGIDL